MVGEDTLKCKMECTINENWRHRIKDNHKCTFTHIPLKSLNFFRVIICPISNASKWELVMNHAHHKLERSITYLENWSLLHPLPLTKSVIDTYCSLLGEKHKRLYVRSSCSFKKHYNLPFISLQRCIVGFRILRWISKCHQQC